MLQEKNYGDDMDRVNLNLNVAWNALRDFFRAFHALFFITIDTESTVAAETRIKSSCEVTPRGSWDVSVDKNK